MLHVLVAPSCPTLCDPMDCSPLSSSVHGDAPEYWSGLSFPSPGDLPDPGIKPESLELQADSLPSELPGKPHVSNNNSLHLLCAQMLSHVWLLVTPWTIARQALLSMGFSRQEYWSGFPFPPPGELPDSGIEPGSPALQAGCLTTEPPGKSHVSNSTKEMQHVEEYEKHWNNNFWWVTFIIFAYILFILMPLFLKVCGKVCEWYKLIL